MHSTINILLNTFGEKMNKSISPDTADFFLLYLDKQLLFSLREDTEVETELNYSGCRSHLFSWPWCGMWNEDGCGLPSATTGSLGSLIGSQYVVNCSTVILDHFHDLQ